MLWTASLVSLSYRRRHWPRLTIFCLLLGCAGPLLAATTQVDEANTDWGFLPEGGTPTFAFAAGPGTPPLGGGSVGFQLTSTSDSVLVGTLLHAGQRLADITVLEYSTYQNVTPQAIALQFNVDYDDQDGTTSWQGRLVYEPSYTETVLVSTWQTWNTLVATGSGNWWSSGTPVVGDAAVAQACLQANPCTWPEMLTAYPDIAVHGGVLGGMLLKAGSGWAAGFDGYADALHIATGAFDEIYDFETNLPVELLSFSVD